MPKIANETENIKIKALDTGDNSFFDLTYEYIDFKIVDNDELFVVDDYIPCINRWKCCHNDNFIKLKYYLDQGHNAIFMDRYESFTNTIQTLDQFDLLQYAHNQRLSIIINSNCYDYWHYLNTDEMAQVIVSPANIIIALNSFEDIYKKNNKPYLFNYLIGCPRWHRLDLLKILNPYLHKALYTNMLAHQTLPDEYENFYNNDAPVDRIIGVTVHNIQYTLGLIIPKIYEDTYFTIIGETNYEYAVNELTEKTFKPILAGHPFVLVGTPGIYQHLHDLGYKTFDGLIDESFDKVKDANLRIMKIGESIKNLCESDLDKFLKLAKPICEHNQKTFLENMGTHSLDLFHRTISFLEKFHAKNS
jgi:hypothetical protein